jgi:ornithine cyclodeaminase
MLFVDDETASSLVTHELAFTSVTAAFRDLSEGTARINPVVISAGCSQGDAFSIKSGVAASSRILGLKVGSYWPRNDRRGIPRHSSSILLLDPDSGRARAFIAANRLNGFRTAAADAVAVDTLARKDAATLSIIGAGHQARFEVAAIRRVRPIQRVLIASRSGRSADVWAGELRAEGIAAVAVDVESACRQADILVTVTPSRAPIFAANWIRPGTHVSSMGSDQAGKQELPTQLLASAALFADLPAQSVVIGEFQHAAALIASGEQRVVAIGEVIRGLHPGRRDGSEITVFDSSGVALQDLYLAAEIVERAIAAGKARAPIGS